MARRIASVFNIGSILQPVHVMLCNDELTIGNQAGKESQLNNQILDKLIVYLHVLDRIKSVTIQNCDITGSQLARLIRNAGLTTVTLNACYFHDGSMMGLAYELNTLTTLKKLEIIECDISDLGVIALLGAVSLQRRKDIILMKNKSITILGENALERYNDSFKGSNNFHFSVNQMAMASSNQQMLLLDAKKIINDCLMNKKLKKNDEH